MITITINFEKCLPEQKTFILSKVQDWYGCKPENTSVVLASNQFDKYLTVNLYSDSVNEFITGGFRILKLIRTKCSKAIITLKRNNDHLSIINQIKKTIARHYNISVEQLVTLSRRRESVEPRQRAMFFAKEMSKASLSEIGKLLGGKDHATVLHAHRTVSNEISTNKLYKKEMAEIEYLLKAEKL